MVSKNKNELKQLRALEKDLRLWFSYGDFEVIQKLGSSVCALEAIVQIRLASRLKKLKVLKRKSK